jgi:hypothetical protein
MVFPLLLLYDVDKLSDIGVYLAAFFVFLILGGISLLSAWSILGFRWQKVVAATLFFTLSTIAGVFVFLPDFGTTPNWLGSAMGLLFFAAILFMVSGGS